MTHRIVIKGRLPGLNKAGRNEADMSGKRRACAMLCAAEARRKRVPAATRPVMLTVLWVEPNYSRNVQLISSGIDYILDGLKMANIIASSTWKDVPAVAHRYAVDPQNARVEIELVEVDA